MAIDDAHCSLVADLVLDAWHRKSPLLKPPASPPSPSYHVGRPLSSVALASPPSLAQPVNRALCIFVQHVAQVTSLPVQQLIFAIRYIYVLTSLHPTLAQCSANGSEIRVFLASVILANKVSDDHFISKRSWEHVSSIPLQELNRMELEVLNGMHWNVNVSKMEYDGWFDYVASFHSARRYHQRATLAGSLLAPVSPVSPVLVDQQRQLSSRQEQYAYPYMPVAITKRNRSSSHSVPLSNPHSTQQHPPTTTTYASTMSAHTVQYQQQQQQQQSLHYEQMQRHRSASQSDMQTGRPPASTLLSLIEHPSMDDTAAIHTTMPVNYETVNPLHSSHQNSSIFAPPSPRSVHLPPMPLRHPLVYQHGVVAPLARAAVLSFDVGRVRSVGYRRASVDTATTQFARRAAANATMGMTNTMNTSPDSLDLYPNYQQLQQTTMPTSFYPDNSSYYNQQDLHTSVSDLHQHHLLEEPSPTTLRQLTPIPPSPLLLHQHNHHPQHCQEQQDDLFVDLTTTNNNNSNAFSTSPSVYPMRRLSPLTLPPLHSIYAVRASNNPM